MFGWFESRSDDAAEQPPRTAVRSSEVGYAFVAEWEIGRAGVYHEPFAAYVKLYEGRRDQCGTLTFSNTKFLTSVCPTRGMGLGFAGVGRRDRNDEEQAGWPEELWEHGFGWRSPAGGHPVHPSLVNLTARGGLGWLDGFNELLTRCGLSWMGPPGDDPGGHPIENPLTLHGRIANTPADRWEMRKEEGRLIVEGEVSERSLFGSNLTLHARYECETGSPELHLTDTVTNAGDTPAEMMLLYHVNQTPLGSRVIVPCEEVIPRDPRAAEGVDEWATLGPPQPGFAEQAYFLRPRPDADGRGRMLMPADDGSVTLEVRFEVETLPWCVLWKQLGGRRDGYVVGMEPATCLPNHRSFERAQGRVTVLQPDETRVMRLTLRFLTEPDEVRTAVAEAEALAADPPTVHPAPLPEFCQSAA